MILSFSQTDSHHPCGCLPQFTQRTRSWRVTYRKVYPCRHNSFLLTLHWLVLSEMPHRTSGEDRKCGLAVSLGRGGDDGLINSRLVSAPLICWSHIYHVCLHLYLHIYLHISTSIDSYFTVLSFRNNYVPEQEAKLILLWSQYCLMQGQKTVPLCLPKEPPKVTSSSNSGSLDSRHPLFQLWMSVHVFWWLMN